MIRLVYKSRQSRRLHLKDLAFLMERASAKNMNLGIHGLLIVTQSEFLQVLEGPDCNVMDLFSSISADDRHRDVELLLKTNEFEPAFDKWFMKAVTLVPLQAPVQELLETKYSYDPGSLFKVPDNPELAQSLLLDLYRLYSLRQSFH